MEEECEAKEGDEVQCTEACIDFLLVKERNKCEAKEGWSTMHHRSMSPGVEEMKQPVGGDDAKARASRGEQEQQGQEREDNRSRAGAGERGEQEQRRVVG